MFFELTEFLKRGNYQYKLYLFNRKDYNYYIYLGIIKLIFSLSFVMYLN